VGILHNVLSFWCWGVRRSWRGQVGARILSHHVFSNPIGQLIQQGQAVAQAVINQLQQQILGFVQQAVGQISSLVGSIGGRFDFLNDILANFKPILEQLAGQALGQLLGGLQGLIGGRALENIPSILGDFWASITGALSGMGQHLVNQGLGAVLGGLGSLGGRGIGDIFAGLSAQVGAAVTAAQGALVGAWSGLQGLGSNLIDATKPHLGQLQEQLVGHGLNALGSLSETINNLHGSITGGR